MKKMVKVKNPAGFLENPAGFFKPRGVFKTLRGVFPPHFQMGEKTRRFFLKKINIKISSRNKFVWL